MEVKLLVSAIAIVTMATSGNSPPTQRWPDYECFQEIGGRALMTDNKAPFRRPPALHLSIDMIAPLSLADAASTDRCL